LAWQRSSHKWRNRSIFGFYQRVYGRSIFCTNGDWSDGSADSKGVERYRRNVVITTLASGWPDLLTIGKEDAGGIVSGLYGIAGDFSSWSGAPLFISLGEKSFFNKHIVEPDTAATALNGAYDVFALFYAFAKALPAAGSSLDVASIATMLKAPFQNGNGLVGTAGDVLNATDEAVKYLDDRFGITHSRLLNIACSMLRSRTTFDPSFANEKTAC
jgi:hypothetical protein